MNRTNNFKTWKKEDHRRVSIKGAQSPKRTKPSVAMQMFIEFRKRVKRQDLEK